MKIVAISVSDRKGIRKKNIDKGALIEDFGLDQDAHGGKWHRQVSFLAQESINTMRNKGLDVVAGNFAENITTEGIDLTKLEVGRHLSLGETEVIISQLGKVCHHKCAIFYQVGDCVMPREGVFAVVKKGGVIKVGDQISILPDLSPSVGIIGTKKVLEESGDNLRNLLIQKWSPAFVRFDQLNKKEDNLAIILEDLTKVQQLKIIVLFDPSGRHRLALLNFDSAPKGNFFTQEKSKIYFCSNIDELAKL